MHYRLAAAFVAVTVAASMTAALASPPYQTDDPGVPPLGHTEAYWAWTSDNASDGRTVNVPQFEIHTAIRPRLMLHLAAPFVMSRDGSGRLASGIGDTEVGALYQLVNDDKNGLLIGTLPVIELPTGNAASGLGEGKLWYRLPLWVEKDWRRVSAVGGGGEVVDTAPGARDHAFGGVRTQVEVAPRLALGAELYGQGAERQGSQGYLLYDVASIVHISEHLDLYAGIGHSVSGESHAVAALGLRADWPVGR